MLYFTSDLHLGHINAIKFADRPFSDIEHMDQALIDNINQCVGEEDELWVLGDFAYRITMDEICRLRSGILCRHMHLVYGNHDKKYEGTQIFESVQHYKELKTDYGRVVLFHYPICRWNAMRYGSIHLHGHIHSTGEYNAANLEKRIELSVGEQGQRVTAVQRIYDVGVDANDYRPVSLAEIAERMEIEPIKKRSV